MGEVYIISDLHLGHRMIANARGFNDVGKHDDALVERWNEVVKRKRDVVWVLGDVAFKRGALAKMAQMNGQKKLVLGNHDRFTLDVYQRYFSQIYGLFEYDKCLLTHIPVAGTQFKRYRLNVHGHMHERNMPDPRYVNVSAEQSDLRPRLLKPLLEHWAGRRDAHHMGCPEGHDGAMGKPGDKIAQDRARYDGGNRIL